MQEQETQPPTEYVMDVQRKMPAWKRASIGAAMVIVVVILALTANIWLPALLTVIAFCICAVLLILFIGFVIANMFVREGPTLEDYQAIEEAREKYGLFQKPVVEGSTVEQQNMVDAIEKLATHAMQMDEKIEQHNATVDAKLSTLYTMVTHTTNLLQQNSVREAPVKAQGDKKSAEATTEAKQKGKQNEKQLAKFFSEHPGAFEEMKDREVEEVTKISDTAVYR